MASMTASPKQASSLFAAPFWRVCAALLCVLLTTSLMNVVVFPRFDAVFTYARDVSVLANAVTLIAVGLAATFKPAFLHMRALTAGCLALLAAGSALLPVGLYGGSAVALTAAACALSIGRGWAIVLTGVAASRLEVGQAGACIALAFVAEYAATALVWVIPAGAGTVLFALLPFATVALVWRTARPVLQATESGEAPADFSVTQPSTFLPLASQLLFTRQRAFLTHRNTVCNSVYSEPATITIFIPLNRLSTGGWLHSEFIAQTSFRETPVFGNRLRTSGGQLIIIHGYCISFPYIRTTPLWPLLCSMQHAQDIHFSPLAVDLINQNKMRVNNQFPGTFHTTVAAFIRLPGQAAG